MVPLERANELDGMTIIGKSSLDIESNSIINDGLPGGTFYRKYNINTKKSKEKDKEKENEIKSNFSLTF